jgi:hypothetical protein
MSSEIDQARMVAERIARRVSGGNPAPLSQSNAGDISEELAAMRASLGELQNRLIQIESRVRSVNQSAPVSTASAPRTHSPWLAGVNPNHPSQERFGVEEATVSELVDFFQSEKTCSVEPGGKPCDHCAMCSARGF